MKKQNKKPYTNKKCNGRVETKFPHFRYYRKSNHPALIVGEVKAEKEEYKYRKVSHSDKEGNRASIKIEPNPNKKDKKPMYISKRVRHDIKDNFEDKPLSWKVPKNLQ